MTQKHDFSASEPRTQVWTGRSGQRYVMRAVASEAGIFLPDLLYALAERGVLRWVGAAQDLIGDHTSRNRFRAASAHGAQLLCFPAPQDPLAVMTVIWDLDGSHVLAERSAA